MSINATLWIDADDDCSAPARIAANKTSSVVRLGADYLFITNTANARTFAQRVVEACDLLDAKRAKEHSE